MTLSDRQVRLCSALHCRGDVCTALHCTLGAGEASHEDQPALPLLQLLALPMPYTCTGTAHWMRATKSYSPLGLPTTVKTTFG